MNIKASKILKNVYHGNIDVAKDMKGTRLLRYSWISFFNAGISDVYETIYRKELSCTGELHGLFYYPEQSFLFCSAKGKFYILAFDLRPESASFLKGEKKSIDCKDGTQIYLPIGFAWGILSQDDHAIVQIHAKAGGSQNLIRLDPLDAKLDFSWGLEEFSIAPYDLPAQRIEDFIESLTPNMGE